MITVVLSILISPCDSGAVVDPVNRVTEVRMCADTVKITKRRLVDEFDYADYQRNFFRLRKVMIGGKNYVMLR